MNAAGALAPPPQGYHRWTLGGEKRVDTRSWADHNGVSMKPRFTPPRGQEGLAIKFARWQVPPFGFPCVQEAEGPYGAAGPHQGRTG